MAPPVASGNQNTRVYPTRPGIGTTAAGSERITIAATTLSHLLRRGSGWELHEEVEFANPAQKSVSW